MCLLHRLAETRQGPDAGAIRVTITCSPVPDADGRSYVMTKVLHRPGMGAAVTNHPNRNRRKPTPPHTPKPAPTDQVEGEVFDLDAREREQAFAPFPFKLGGRTFTLPHLRKIDRKLLVAADSGDMAAMTAAFKVGLGEDYGAFDELPLSLDGLDELFRRWLTHSGLEPGESLASPRS